MVASRRSIIAASEARTRSEARGNAIASNELYTRPMLTLSFSIVHLREGFAVLRFCARFFGRAYIIGTLKPGDITFPTPEDTRPREIKWSGVHENFPRFLCSPFFCHLFVARCFARRASLRPIQWREKVASKRSRYTIERERKRRDAK